MGRDLLWLVMLETGGVDSVCEGLGAGLDSGKRESGRDTHRDSELSQDNVDDD